MHNRLSTQAVEMSRERCVPDLAAGCGTGEPPARAAVFAASTCSVEDAARGSPRRAHPALVPECSLSRVAIRHKLPVIEEVCDQGTHEAIPCGGDRRRRADGADAGR